MDTSTAATLARKLMAEHGLTDKGWWFAFDGAQKRLGLCNHTRKRISISRHMAGAATEEQVTQTMLHEIAHALVGERDARGQKIGHGHAWKVKAASIGYTGKRTAANPYVDQQRAASGLPPRPTGPVSPESNIGHRDRVRLRNGVTGTVLKAARSRWHIAGDDGQTWTAPFGSVTKLEGQAPARVPEAKSEKVYGRGDPVKIIGGQQKYRGRTATVLSVGTSRYKIRFDDDGDQLYAPFGLVGAI